MSIAAAFARPSALEQITFNTDLLKCGGYFCGRQFTLADRHLLSVPERLLLFNRSLMTALPRCGPCQRGYTVDQATPLSECRACNSALSFYDWLFILVVVAIPLIYDFGVLISETSRCANTTNNKKNSIRTVQTASRRISARSFGNEDNEDTTNVDDATSLDNECENDENKKTEIPIGSNSNTVRKKCKESAKKFSRKIAFSRFCRPLNSRLKRRFEVALICVFLCLEYALAMTISLLLWPPVGSLRLHKCAASVSPTTTTTNSNADDEHLKHPIHAWYPILFATLNVQESASSPSCTHETVFPLFSLTLCALLIRILLAALLRVLLHLCLLHNLAQFRRFAYSSFYVSFAHLALFTVVAGLLYAIFGYALIALGLLASALLFSRVIYRRIRGDDATAHSKPVELREVLYVTFRKRVNLYWFCVFTAVNALGILLASGATQSLYSLKIFAPLLVVLLPIPYGVFLVTVQFLKHDN